MPIMMQNGKIKLMCGGSNITKMYCQGDVIYSSGNIVTYIVDPGITYQEEVEEGESCLEPKTFATPAKNGYLFAGWSAVQGGAVVDSMTMGDEPITLYAVWVASAHYFTPLNSVTWTIVKDYGTENNLTKSANQIKITARKPENTVAYGELTVSAKIPTRGCKKVRFTATASKYASASITYNTQQKHFAKTGSPSNVEFDISGDYINITFGVADSTSYFLAECILTSIYFYN